MATVIVRDDEILNRLYQDRRKFMVEVTAPEGPHPFEVGIKTARQMLRHAEQNGWLLEAQVVNYLAFLTIESGEKPGEQARA